jgi:hypothetical protein
MAMVTLGAFVSGFAVGWVARGLSDAPRGEMVRNVAKGFHVSDAVRRWVSERAEWVEDLVAEGQAHYEATRGGAAERS